MTTVLTPYSKQRKIFQKELTQALLVDMVINYRQELNLEGYGNLTVSIGLLVGMCEPKYHDRYQE